MEDTQGHNETSVACMTTVQDKPCNVFSSTDKSANSVLGEGIPFLL